jgi:diaminopimelate epimerase
MRPRFWFMDPGGNRTVLVTQRVDEADRAGVAARLLADEPSAEQVGFIGSGDGETALTLEMAGGEFCGNASMCAAVYCAASGGLASADVTLRVSGAGQPVRARVSAEPESAGVIWSGSVEMPRAEKIEPVTFPDGTTVPVVFFPGIAHCIFECGPDRARAEKKIKGYCAFLRAPALGFMFVCGDKLTPLVYVPKGDTLYWESSCGSGSSAVGVYAAAGAKSDVVLTLRQPGGSLTVSAAPSGSVTLSGTVTVLKRDG